MDCRYCGNELPAGATTCPLCGGPAPSANLDPGPGRSPSPRESASRAADQETSQLETRSEGAAASPPSWSPPEALASRPDAPKVSGLGQQQQASSLIQARPQAQQPGFQQQTWPQAQQPGFQQQTWPQAQQPGFQQQTRPQAQQPGFQHQVGAPPTWQSQPLSVPSQAPAKRRLTYILLGLLLGGLGIHNFYAGYTGRAVTQLILTLFFWWLIVPMFVVWIWVLIEVITVEKDAKGVPFA